MIIAELENAIIAHLAARSGAGDGKLGYTLNVGTYEGEFDSEEDLAEAARVKFPCALILMKEIGRGTPVGGGQKVPLTYTMFVATKSRRNAAARRRGAGGAIGSYQIAWDVRQLLKGQMFGFDDDIDTLLPGPVTSIINGKVKGMPVSVYACTFTTTWYEDLTPVHDDVVGEFLELDVAWDIPPHGNVKPPLPAVEADARDLVKPRETTP